MILNTKIQTKMTAEWTPEYGLETETRARPANDAKNFRKNKSLAKNKVTYIYQPYINKKLILYIIRIYNKHTKKRKVQSIDRYVNNHMKKPTTTTTTTTMSTETCRTETTSETDTTVFLSCLQVGPSCPWSCPC